MRFGNWLLEEKQATPGCKKANSAPVATSAPKLSRELHLAALHLAAFSLQKAALHLGTGLSNLVFFFSSLPPFSFCFENRKLTFSDVNKVHSMCSENWLGLNLSACPGFINMDLAFSNYEGLGRHDRDL